MGLILFVPDGVHKRAGVGLGSDELINAGFRRFQASADTERFYYIYFEDRDGDEAHRFGLVRIDKATGDEMGRLWINERDPAYVLDPETQSVFYQEGDTVIRAVKF